MQKYLERRNIQLEKIERTLLDPILNTDKENLQEMKGMKSKLFERNRQKDSQER